MENNPVEKNNQEFKTANSLKKGKYGFYRNVEKINSVYGEDKETKPVFSEKDLSIEKPITYSAFKPATETNHYIYPEKIKELFEGFFSEKIKPFWMNNNGFVKEGFDDVAGGAINEMTSSTGSIKNEAYDFYNQLLENWKQIEDDVNIIADPNGRQSDKLKGFIHLIRDFILLFYTAISVLNVNSHPNIIDIMGETLTKMFVDSETGGMVDKEQSRLAIYYFTMIAYASVFIFIAYVATENWYYFLFYEFSENMMTEVLDKDGNPEKKEWSLQQWWSYYEKTRPNLFGLVHALFYVVTAIDSILRKLRNYTKGSDNYSPIIHVLLYLCIYYWFNYFVTITSSPAFDIIFMIIVGFAVFRVCILSYGSFSFAAASQYYPPSLFSLVISIIKFIVLLSINFSLIPIGKMAVYAYLMFMSFGIISFSETKRKNRGITGRFFDTVREMRDYLLLNAKIVSEKTGAGKFEKWAYFIESSWLSISVILIFLFLFISLFPNTKDIQLFAPIFYFILIFWGISIVKIFINYLKKNPNISVSQAASVSTGNMTTNTTTGTTGNMTTNTTGQTNTLQQELENRRNNITSNLSQINFINGVQTLAPKTEYETGFGLGTQIGKDLGKNVFRQGVDAYNTVANPKETIKKIIEQKPKTGVFETLSKIF